jgi:hypothetical protein
VTDEHDHALPLSPDVLADPRGLPVDMAMLARLIGAAFEGCASCQDPLMTLLVPDAPSVARLVELACVATYSLFGFLPANMTDPDVPGRSGPAFRKLAAAGADGENAALFELCEQMDPRARREATNDALEILVGHLVTATS